MRNKDYKVRARVSQDVSAGSSGQETRLRSQDLGDQAHEPDGVFQPWGDPEDDQHVDLGVGEDLCQLGGVVPLPVDPCGTPAPAQQRLQLRMPCSLPSWCLGAQQGPAHPWPQLSALFQDLPESGPSPFSVPPRSVGQGSSFLCPWPCIPTLGTEVTPVLRVSRRGHESREWLRAAQLTEGTHPIH